MATSATLKWNPPLGYESIASSGGVWYTITVENMATGQNRTVTADNTMLSYSMAQSTQYCFTVRAEVSGGSGVYSMQKCTTTPGTTEYFHVTSEWCNDKCDKLGMSLHICCPHWTPPTEHGSCFCVNGVYNTEKEECICQSGYYGTYCSGMCTRSSGQHVREIGLGLPL